MDYQTIELLLKVGGIVFAVGAIYGELKNIRKDITRLESKQEKYNNLQTRVLRNELTIEQLDKEIAEIKGQSK